MPQERTGQIAVSVDRNAAGYMYEDPHLMPQILRTKQTLIRAVAFGGLLVSIALFFLVTWWWAFLALVFSLTMFTVAQKQAARGVLDAALLDPRIYQIATDKHVLIVKEQA
jgi:hypothetical protein